MIEIEIEGVTPLLMNRFTDEAQMKATSGSASPLVGDRGSGREQAEPKMYTHDGTIGIPQPNLFRCIMDAGKYFKAGRSKVTTQKSSLIPACVDIDPLFIPLKFEGDWQVDTRPVRIPATGGRILAHRPMFEKWGLEFVVGLDKSIISETMFREIVDAAGKRVGLGDFRPDTKGPFGKFVVVKWERT
jgi:hypothetical protein